MPNKPDQRISDKLDNPQPLFSVEFFPPKNEEGARQILRTAHLIKAQTDPDFVSITYGAGGSTRERTQEYAELTRDIFHFDVMPHLTCVGHSRQELKDILERFYQSGFRNIMALRGDPPKDGALTHPHPDGLRHASELVAFIRDCYPAFCLGVAGYPEKHPESPSAEADLQHLKHKVDQGASFITTQLFFDNADYFRFVEQARAIGIDVPIIAGLMPVISSDQLRRFCAMCGARIPSRLGELLDNAGADGARVLQIGINWAYDQIAELTSQGAPGVHLYILNRPHSALELIRKLRYHTII